MTPLQMMVYVIVQLVEEFENKATKPDSLQLDMPLASRYCLTDLPFHWHVYMHVHVYTGR